MRETNYSVSSLCDIGDGKDTHRSMHRNREPKIENPYMYGQRIFDKGEKTVAWRKESLFNKWCWKVVYT